jgi:hypothetical protein
MCYLTLRVVSPGIDLNLYSASAVEFASAGTAPTTKHVCGWAGSIKIVLKALNALIKKCVF